jgi:hypothetical protein
VVGAVVGTGGGGTVEGTVVGRGGLEGGCGDVFFGGLGDLDGGWWWRVFEVGREWF